MNKIQNILNGKKQSEDTEQTSDSDMAGMFEFSDHEIKITIMNMLRALMGKNRQHWF